MGIVPFSVSADVSDLTAGVMEWVGEVAFEDGVLRLRYRGETYGDKEEEDIYVDIALDDLAGLDFKRGWFGGCTMTLRAARIDTFDGIPFAGEGRVALSIARRYREVAVNLMATVQTRLDFPETG